MSLAIVYTRASAGISAPLVTVEAHLSPGFPRFNIVGLPETAVKESKDRVRSALINSNFEFPRKRITVNLAPADLPKEGGRFDLAIALGILAASGQIPLEKLMQHEFIGELALSGELRSVTGVLPTVLSIRNVDRTLIIPQFNVHEAALVKTNAVLAANHLLEVCAYLQNQGSLLECKNFCKPEVNQLHLDLSDIRGQIQAKNALEIAAAGKHSLLLTGPPGTGKTMLAMRLSGILPELTEDQALELAAITSLSSAGFDASKWQHLPFRSPHHSSSNFALVGGGRPPRPGEISLAHHGILFLDELPEFQRHVLESLREPLESGQITISRAAFQISFPAKFQLVAAMNPCPCGYAGSPIHHCCCTEEKIQRYRAKLSGPFLDRIDIHVEVPTQKMEILTALTHDAEKSSLVKTRVIAARRLQLNRQGKSNAELIANELEQHCLLDTQGQNLLNQAMQKFNFSARVYHRILKIARTVADLQGAEKLSFPHISEALIYRGLGIK